MRAKHGATTGKLDEQMMFYLLSRGIDRPTAQTLLQWAFIEDAVSKIGLPALRGEIERLIAARLLKSPRSTACWQSHERQSRNP